MRTNLNPLMSHKRADWETPPELFEMLDREFHFTVDAAANTENTLCARWYGPGGVGEDALEMPWDGVVWCNPPYGPAVANFVDAALFAIGGRIATTVVMLLPSRTDTRWFHRLAESSHCVFRFMKGRIKFRLHGEPIRDAAHQPVGAPFPSLIAILAFQQRLCGVQSSFWSER